MASLTDDIAPLNTKPDTLNRCPVLAAVIIVLRSKAFPFGEGGTAKP